MKPLSVVYSLMNTFFISSDLKKIHDDFKPEGMTNNQGILYSVSQRVAPANSNFSNLCQNESNFPPEQVAYSSMSGEWDRELAGSEMIKDGSSEVSSDKQTNSK